MKDKFNVFIVITFLFMFSLVFTKISVHLEHISNNVKIILTKIK
jgi:hypothetical protein